LRQVNKASLLLNKFIFMSTQITKAKAMEYVNHYRDGLPSGSLRSAWLNRDFIDAIITLDGTATLDGVRVYLGKYTERGQDPEFNEGDVTVILVPTENGDDLDAYHDYSKICPPHCDGDEGD
jgi:hypothetical protein